MNAKCKQWTVPTKISTDNVYADLQWEKQGDSFVEIYKITEKRPGGFSRVSYVDKASICVYRVEPGMVWLGMVLNIF